MELNLQPLASACAVTGEPFGDGERVVSFLVRGEASGEVVRHDVLASAQERFAPEGFVACRWVHAYKIRKAGENPERELKLTAENLFTTLADPSVELAPENERLVQFLALMLERKRLLRPKGPSADGRRAIYEHAKTKQLYEVPAGELNPEFFLSIQEQLGALVGGGAKPAAKAPTSEAITPEASN